MALCNANQANNKKPKDKISGEERKKTLMPQDKR